MTDSPLLSSLDQAYGVLASLRNPSHHGLLDRIFGEGAQTAYESSALSTPETFDTVGLTLVDGLSMRGHPGAFASHYLDGNPEILLNRDWIQTATTDQITGVLLEELGHAIDWVVNGEDDTPGDEGAAFAAALLQINTTHRSWNTRILNNDRGSIQMNGSTINVEFATTYNFSLSNWSKTISGGDGDVFHTLASPSITAAIDGTGPQGSGSPSGEEVGNSFDGDLGTKYLNFGGIDSGIDFSFSTPVSIKGFQLATANDSDERDPSAYVLQGYNGSSWVSVSSGSLNLPLSRNTWGETVNFSNGGSYNRYRIIFTDLRDILDQAEMQIAELRLFGSRASGTSESVLIQGSDASTFSPQTADYTTTSAINGPGFAKYDWSYVNSDLSAGDDLFGYLIGSNFNRLDNGAGSGGERGFITPFFSTPSSFGYRVSTGSDSGGSLSATVSNFSFTPIADTYYTRFNQILSATFNGGTSFSAGSELSNEVWVFPENPTSDSDFSSAFNNNGSNRRVWIVANGLNNGQPLEVYMTNAREMAGGAQSPEDVWVFNTQPNNSGSYYILTSGSYTQSPSTTVQVNASVDIEKLNLLRASQNAPAPSLLSINASDYNFKIGDTATVTFVFNTPVSGFSDADVVAPNGTLSGLASNDGITWTATFTPRETPTGVEDSTNTWSVDLSGVTSGSGLTGSGTFASANYTVDTVRPKIAITSDKTVMSHGQTALITFTLSENSINFDQSDVIVDRGTLSEWRKVSQSVYTAVFMPTDTTNQDSRISVASNKFTDLAGNDNRDGSDSDNQRSINIAPTAIIRSTSTSVQPGSLNTVTISLTEPSNNFSQASIRSNVTLKNFKKVTPPPGSLLSPFYEVQYVAPSSGKVTLSIIAGSYTDKINGNNSVANPDGQDTVTVDVIATSSIESNTATSSGRGLTGGIQVGRAKSLPTIKNPPPVVPASKPPQPIGRSAATGVFRR